jgi:hypothetical protein
MSDAVARSTVPVAMVDYHHMRTSMGEIKDCDGRFPRDLVEDLDQSLQVPPE